MKWNKMIALLLSAALLTALWGCAAEPEREETPRETVTDGAGRSVPLPEVPEEATAASVYAVAVPFYVALGITDRVRAVNVKSGFWKTADKNLAAADTVGRGVVDLEKLAALAPTVLIHRSNDPETVEAVERLGIDVVCITVENMEDIYATLRLLGRYFGAEERAEKTAAWLEKKLALIDSIVETIPPEERKTALLMGGEPGRVAGSDMLQTWMIERAGGIPVVDVGENHNWINVGVEKIFAYDPEVLFCTGSTARSYKTEELLTDEAWSALAAVRTGDVYVIPAAADGWDMPGISCVLGIFYMIREMYPAYFSASDFEDEVDDYYRFMFGRCFDDELGLDWSEY